MADRAVVLTRLAQLAAEGDPEEPWMARLTDAARRLVNARGASVSLLTDETSRVMLAATDDVAAKLEDLQDVLAEGPCRHAYREDVALSADLEYGSGRLWPEYIRSAREVAGDVIIHCFPMRPVGAPIGVFTVYAPAGSLTESPRVLQWLADAIGSAVLSDEDLVETSGAWGGRSVVHQATGMLVAQFGVGPVDALAILRAHAFAQNTTVADTAEQIVQRRLDLRQES